MRATAVTPILNVSDFEASVAWFGKLGWAPGFFWRAPGEQPPSFGAVISGVAEIFLCQDGQGARTTAGSDTEAVWLAIWVRESEEVDAVHIRCIAEGIEVLREPQDEVWEVRECHVRHPDGHVLRISAPVRHGHQPDPSPEPGHR